MTKKSKQPNISIKMTGNEITSGRDITIGQQNIEKTYRSNSSITIENFMQDIDAIKQILQKSLVDRAKLDEIDIALANLQEEGKKETPNKKSLLEKVKLAFETITATYGATEAMEKLAPLLNAAMSKAVHLFS